MAYSTGLSQSGSRLVLDYAIFVGFILVMVPHLTGNPVHEWLGLLLTVGAIAHLLIQWQWLTSVTKRFFRPMATQVRLNWVVDALLFVSMTVVMLSGLMVSESLASLAGITLAKNDAMHMLHSLSATSFVYLMALHVALHWTWVVRVTKNLLLPEDRSGMTTYQPEV